MTIGSGLGDRDVADDEDVGGRPLGDVAFVNVNVEALKAGFHRSER